MPIISASLAQRVLARQDVSPPLVLPPAVSPILPSSPAWRHDLLQLLRRTTKPRMVRRPLPSRAEINVLLERILPRYDLDPRQMPAFFRQRVSQRVHEYTRRSRKDVQATLLRADVHLPMIKHLFRQHGLPTYYAYLPLVESAFRPDVSHPISGARGLWQFIDTTARTFGLEVSASVDERLDPKHATQAAARYLHTLRQRFGAQRPLHVLAAYNFGENNLARAMRRAQTRDLWALYRRHHLPAETREYLLRMVTMWVIVTQPGRFYFVIAEAADTPARVSRAGPQSRALLELAWSVPGIRE